MKNVDGHGIETAKEIGKLIGTVEALAKRIEKIDSDSINRHTETIKMVTDIQAQIHEVKHTQNNDAAKVIALAERNKLETEKHNEQHKNLVNNIKEIKDEILTNRETTGTRLDELFSLRNKVAGGFFIIFLMFSLYVHEASEFIKHLFVKTE